MGKHEFLDILSKRLTEELPREAVIDHLRYYEAYINTELDKGRTLDAVMDELGDPIMIAHTIINTETGESFQGYAEDAEFVEIPREVSEAEGDIFEKGVHEEEVSYTHLHTENEEEYRAKEQQKEQMEVKQKGQMGCILVSALIVILLVAVLSLVGSLISFLLPILLPVLLIVIVISFASGKK